MTHRDHPRGVTGSRPASPSTALASERWRIIQRLVDGALDRRPADRAAYLAAECGSDAALYESAARLLDACHRASKTDALFARSAASYAAPILAAGAADDASRDRERRAALADALRAAVAGRYEIERELGRGGMATVYLARDLRHDRVVAVKVLERDVVSPAGAERFLREIRIAARLTHPHVLGVHDSGDADGVLYYVMPYVDGETLRTRLAREGALPLPEAVRLIRELADAVAYAHAQGVVHRDLKPENVLLAGTRGDARAGHAVVADFGIAKALASATGADGSASTALTTAGVALGTPAYMAPEQALGDEATDHRADLYALGVIAYEIVAGAHPFGSRSPQALVSAHLTEPPPPVQTRRADLPTPLAALIMQLLAKDPAARPQNADAVVRALDETVVTSRERRVSQPLAGGRRAAMLTAAVVILAAGLGAYFAWRDARRGNGDADAGTSGRTAGSTSDASAIRTVAVLPFVNTGGVASDDYFSDGLTDELAHALARLPGLRLAGRTSSYAFKGKTAPAREIGRTLGVGAFVTGTVHRAGDRIRVKAQLVSATNGTVLRDAASESGTGDVFAVQDELTRTIVAAISPVLGDARTSGAAEALRGTSDQEAYDLYLKGRYHWHERGADNVRAAIGYFEEAIARDPGFARAHTGLAQAYGVLPAYVAESFDSANARAAASAERAVTLDSTIADAHVAMGLAMELQGKPAAAEARYRAAAVLEPWSSTPHHWLGWLLLSLGRTGEALAELQRAVQVDPLAKSPGSALGWGLTVARRFAEAEAASRRVLALDSTFSLALLNVAVTQAFTGRGDEAVRTLERLRQFHPDAAVRPPLLFAYAAAGRWSDAARLRAELRENPQGSVGHADAAFAELVFGDPEPFVALVSGGDPTARMPVIAGTFGCNPFLDPLWSDPRFVAAMRRRSVESCTLARPWPIAPPPAELRRAGQSTGSARR